MTLPKVVTVQNAKRLHDLAFIRGLSVAEKEIEKFISE
jgi:hypothetical protein